MAGIDGNNNVSLFGVIDFFGNDFWWRCRIHQINHQTVFFGIGCLKSKTARFNLAV